MHDYQVKNVYRWEDKHFPEGPDVKFEHAQALVNHVWAAEGLLYPPIVSPFETNVRKSAGKANRLNIWLQPVVSTKTILHEIAHSMTSDFEHGSAWHGPMFVGVYAKLLQKYMGVDLFTILQTCAIEKVDIDIMASPIFTD